MTYERLGCLLNVTWQRHGNCCEPIEMRWSWTYSRAVSVEWYL